MRLGLIGLGRIDSFHAGTLSALPQLTSLVVHDPMSAAVQVATARLDVEPVDGPEVRSA